MAKVTTCGILRPARGRPGYGDTGVQHHQHGAGLAVMRRRMRSTRPSSSRPRAAPASITNDIMLARMIDALVEMYPHIPLCLHQDPVTTKPPAPTAINHGFTPVMMDGSLKGRCQGESPIIASMSSTHAASGEMGHWIGVKRSRAKGPRRWWLRSSTAPAAGAGGWAMSPRARVSRETMLTRSGWGGRFLCARPRSMRWRSPSAGRMAPTNSAASLMARSRPWDGLRRSICCLPDTQSGGDLRL